MLTEILRLELEQPIIVKKHQIHEGDIILANNVLFTYSLENELSKSQTYKIPFTAQINKILFNRNDIIQPNQPLFEVIPGCSHPTLLKGMCAICGQLVSEIKSDNYLSIIHNTPQLIVHQDHALIMSRTDKERLLLERRLILVVDLDHTLIHTTTTYNTPPIIMHAVSQNHNLLESVYNINSYTLPGDPVHVCYHTKYRPGAMNFLEEMSKLYELHICTFGARPYANIIANILDKDGRLFSRRILSRDEFVDSTSKTPNLKSLFPVGDDMVCIIDDREDVWNSAPNLIHVKPYRYFETISSVELVNSILKYLCGNTPYPAPNKTDQAIATVYKSANDITPVYFNLQQDCHIFLPQDREKINAENASNNTDIESSICLPPQSDSEAFEDPDDYLFYLEDILRNIHAKFFEIYDKKNKAKKAKSSLNNSASDIDATTPINSKKNGCCINGTSVDQPSLKKIIPHMKKTVLAGCHIVFSGIFPRQIALHQSREGKMACALGAKIAPDIIPRVTTHLIASSRNTNKLNMAKRYSNSNDKSIHIVNIDWLLACYERWERVSEQLFPVLLTTPPSYILHPLIKDKISKESTRCPDSIIDLSSSEDDNLPDTEQEVLNKDDNMVDQNEEVNNSISPNEFLWKLIPLDPIPPPCIRLESLLQTRTDDVTAQPTFTYDKRTGKRIKTGFSATTNYVNPHETMKIKSKINTKLGSYAKNKKPTENSVISCRLLQDMENEIDSALLESDSSNNSEIDDVLE